MLLKNFSTSMLNFVRMVFEKNGQTMFPCVGDIIPDQYMSVNSQLMATHVVRHLL